MSGFSGPSGCINGFFKANVHSRDRAAVARAMKQVSPKYIPRESMLVEAYTSAEKGDNSAIVALQDLFRRPYEDQPFFGEKFYRQQAPGAKNQGGVGFMS